MIDMNVKQECLLWMTYFKVWQTDGVMDRLTDDREVIPEFLHAMQATQLGTTIAYLVPDSERLWD